MVIGNSEGEVKEKTVSNILKIGCFNIDYSCIWVYIYIYMESHLISVGFVG